MKWNFLLETIANEPVFSSKLLMAGRQSCADIQLQLSRWVKAGKIIQLRRGWYVLAAPFRKVNAHPFLIANRLKNASYISLQSALAYYGMIPEYVPVVTSITTGRPEVVKTSEGTFVFRHIRKSLLKGYVNLEISDGQFVFIATPEKSLQDLIYLTPGSQTLGFMQELRLQNLDQLDMEKFRKMAVASGSPKLQSAVKQVDKIIKTEEYTDL